MLIYDATVIEAPFDRPEPKEKFLHRRLLLPFAVFFGVLSVYLGTAVLGWHTSSPPTAYFDLLADAFLRGRLYLIAPPSVHDLTWSRGQWYVPFSPLPALLLLPWVASAGLRQVSTVIFSIGMGATTSTCVYLCLEALGESGASRLRTIDNLWLTVLLAFGTVSWYMSVDGQVWFLGQVSAVTFVAIALLFALRRASAWGVGTGLAIAMLGRPTIVLTYPLLLAAALDVRRSTTVPIDQRRLTGWIIRSAVPIIAVVAGLLAYNAARFGNPLDFGYASENVADWLRQSLRQYGQFNLYFVPHNLHVMLLGLPYWQQQCNRLVPSVEGMSLFLTTPALIYIFRASPRSPMAAGAWLACGLLLIPLFTYYNTGSWQFGYRFSLDFIVPVMVLLAIGSRRRVSWLLRALILVSVAINAVGVAWWLHGWCGFPT